MRRLLSDEEIRKILVDEPSGIGLDLVTINESIIGSTDYDPSKNGEPDYKLVESWVRDVETALDEIESLSSRIRTEQIADSEIERSIYQVQEMIEKTIIQEYRDNIAPEIKFFRGKSEVFGAENFINDHDIESLDYTDLLTNEDELAEEYSKQIEGRPDTLEIAKAYAELLLDYKENIGEEAQGSLFSTGDYDSGR